MINARIFERQIFKSSRLSPSHAFYYWSMILHSYMVIGIRKDNAYNLLYSDCCGRYYTATRVYQDNTMSNGNGLCLTISAFQIYFNIIISIIKQSTSISIRVFLM